MVSRSGSEGEHPPPRPLLTAVLPVRDGGAYLGLSLPALMESSAGIVDEVIVVDDGLDDACADFARDQGARIVPSGGSGLGPALARNVGVEHASAQVVLFVDVDVVVHPDAVALIADAFQDPDTVAVFGSYDARPPHKTFASQYMNLRHHYHHQQASESAGTFWSGLGAVRRHAFLAVGGFDAVTYRRPSIEDIDLGLRLRAQGGRIRRVPGILGTHLKRWTLLQVLRTDILSRALPWSRLMARNPRAFDDLNVSRPERGRAVVAASFFTCILGAAAGLLPPWSPLPALLASGLANRGLARVFLRQNGLIFMIGGIAFHQLYYMYSSAIFAACAVTYRMFPRSHSAHGTREAGKSHA